MEKHTPGPWEVRSNGWKGQFIYGTDARVPGEGRFIGEVSLDFDGAEANANLMAASPDLYEALKVAVEAFYNPGKFNPVEVERMYAAALSKAEGKGK